MIESRRCGEAEWTIVPRLILSLCQSTAANLRGGCRAQQSGLAVVPRESVTEYSGQQRIALVPGSS